MIQGQQLKQSFNHEEVNLIDLLSTLWIKKWLILLITSMFMALGITYILLCTPLYEAKVAITPPTTADLSEIIRHLKKDDPANEVYSTFKKHLFSESIKKNFFYTTYLPSLSNQKKMQYSNEKLYKKFSKLLSIKGIVDSLSDGVAISMKGSNPEDTVQWIKIYLDLAKKNTLDEIVSNIQMKNHRVIKTLQDKINLYRGIAQAKKSDRIAKLNEAMHIAESIDLKANSVSSSHGVIFDEAVYTDPSIMYLRGTKALKAEIYNLAKRNSDDPFTSNLRELQGKLNFYKHDVITTDRTKLFRSDGDVDISDFPIEPKKNLILIFSLLLGLGLGTFIVVMRSLYKGNEKSSFINSGTREHCIST